MPQTVNAAIAVAVARLKAAGITGAALDVRLLMAHALDIAPDRLLLVGAVTIDETAAMRFDAAITARCAFQPVAQIIGKRQFWGRWFRVTPDTLDPRPDTETLVQLAVGQPFETMLDLGTGTGCIILSCLCDMPDAHGVATDVSAAALDVARGNAAELGCAGRVAFMQSDWFSNVTGQFDLIVSNPPYIAADEMAGLSVDVRDWEPHLALTPGSDGLDPYRVICAHAPEFLTPQGRLIVEIGPTQGAAVAQMFTRAGFANVAIHQDLDGRDRVVAGAKAQKSA